MTATYFERFYPHDMDGVVAYVAPNDVVNKEDSAYDRFFANVGTKECRDRLNAVQREALVRREPLEKKYAEVAAAEGYTFNTVGSLDKAYEAVVLDYVWGFWQYSQLADCDSDVIPPDAKTATDDEIWTSIDTISGFSFYTDQGLEPYTPYYYQAGTQLGAPDDPVPAHREEVHPLRLPAAAELRPARHPDEVPAVTRCVTSTTGSAHNAQHMLFVYGQNDPWGAEPFHLGKRRRDSYVFTAPGANHGANVAGLVADAEGPGHGPRS